MATESSTPASQPRSSLPSPRKCGASGPGLWQAAGPFAAAARHHPDAAFNAELPCAVAAGAWHRRIGRRPNGTEITITGYTGPGSAVDIPSTIDGLPVTSLHWGAFYGCTSLTSVTIPDRVTNIEKGAFEYCFSLSNVTIGNSVTSIGDVAFAGCTSLRGVYFQGNAPSLGSGVFHDDINATVYYLARTTGWGSTFGGLPTALWSPQGADVTPPTITCPADLTVCNDPGLCSALVTFVVVATHDQSTKSLASVAGQAAAAQAYAASHSGAPPPGYYVIGRGPLVGPKQ